MVYQKDDFNWSNSVQAENELVSGLRDKGLNVYKNDPFIGFMNVDGHPNDAKVAEANKMMQNIDNPDYKEALQNILDNRRNPQIKPGDHEKAMSRIQKSDSDPDSDPDPGGNVSTTSSGDTSSSTSTSKGKTQVKQTTSSKSTILGMKPMYAYILGGVLVALIAAAIYYSMK